MGFKVPEGVDYIAVNHASWDTLAKLHYHDENDWYKIKGFLDGEDRRAPIDIELMGDLTGKRVLHSQCHFGLDTLSAARFADNVVGLDFSENAVNCATELAKRAGLSHKAEFVCANVYDAGKVLDAESFDMIYASWGVTGWLEDLQDWASTLCGMLKPGGSFVYAEGHPFAWTLEEKDGDHVGALQAVNHYWQDQAIIEEWPESYTGIKIPSATRRAVEFAHTLENFFTVFLAEKMQLDAFREFEGIPWKMYTRMVENPDDGQYYFPEGQPTLPMGFAMKWTKPPRG